MKIFNKEGMLIIPDPKGAELKPVKKILFVDECYCQNGHSLMNSRASFNGLPGIMLKVKAKDRKGLVALSPIYGDKSKISLDIDLHDKELIELSCPICDSLLPAYSTCSCGADLAALFLSKEIDFNNCIGICSRVNCFNSEIKSSSELLNEIGLRTL